MISSFKQAGGEGISDDKAMGPVPVPRPRKTLLRPPLVVLVNKDVGASFRRLFPIAAF